MQEHFSHLQGEHLQLLGLEQAQGLQEHEVAWAESHKHLVEVEQVFEKEQSQDEDILVVMSMSFDV